MQKLIIEMIMKRQCFSVNMYILFKYVLITIYSFLFIAYHLIYKPLLS